MTTAAANSNVLFLKTAISMKELAKQDAQRCLKAIKKTGGVRAKSLHDDEEAAQKALETLGKDYEIEVRPGSRTRCESFCPVNIYCQQWRDYQESKDGN